MGAVGSCEVKICKCELGLNLHSGKRHWVEHLKAFRGWEGLSTQFHISLLYICA